MLSFISTVVNYEYAFYWYLYQVRAAQAAAGTPAGRCAACDCLRPLKRFPTWRPFAYDHCLSLQIFCHLFISRQAGRH